MGRQETQFGFCTLKVRDRFQTPLQGCKQQLKQDFRNASTNVQKQKGKKKKVILQSHSVLFRGHGDFCSIDVTYVDAWPGLSPVPPQLHQSDQMQDSFFLTFSELQVSSALGCDLGSSLRAGMLLPSSFKWYLISGSSRFKMCRLFPAEQFPLTHIMFMGTEKQTRTVFVYNIV